MFKIGCTGNPYNTPHIIQNIQYIDIVLLSVHAHKNADTLTGFRTAAEFPSLCLYATRYGLTWGPLFAPFPDWSLGTIGRPKKSTAIYITQSISSATAVTGDAECARHRPSEQAGRRCATASLRAAGRLSKARPCLVCQATATCTSAVRTTHSDWLPLTRRRRRQTCSLCSCRCLQRGER